MWQKIAILMTYDEAGGFLDHVVPPSAPPPDPDQAEFNYMGFRVPFYLVSPFAKPSYVSHEDHSHTSILRLIQARFDLPALTARDANSDALLDMFDFNMANPPPPDFVIEKPWLKNGGSLCGVAP